MTASPRWISTAVLVILLPGALFAQEKRENGPARVFGGVVNVREQPSLKSRILFSLNAGQPVEILAAAGQERSGIHNDFWYRMRALGREGYVYGAYLALLASDAGEARQILVGPSDQERGSFEIRLVRDSKILASHTFKMLGFSSGKEQTRNTFEKIEVHKDFFGKGAHALLLTSFAGLEADAMFTTGAYAFFVDDRSIRLISQGQGGADAPVSSETSYEFKNGVVIETKEDVEMQDDGFTTGTGERRTFRLVNGRFIASPIEKIQIRRKTAE